MADHAVLEPYKPYETKHYRVKLYAFLRLADLPLSDYPWWSALWDVLITLVGAGMVAVAQALLT